MKSQKGLGQGVAVLGREGGEVVRELRAVVVVVAVAIGSFSGGEGTEMGRGSKSTLFGCVYNNPGDGGSGVLKKKEEEGIF
ncbi:hypothetical protein LIER_24668 [Lithospermum erythrorhizon]|uniref:Uncharacterized protein n=1 Tax=Lithospermum erythrorhizon TaxID=34254 RepID=A0AAV3R243_LITER